MKVIELVMTVRVKYEILGRVTSDELGGRLERVIEDAVNDRTITGGAPANVVSYTSSILHDNPNLI